jgi:hypothetical protein
VGIWWFYFCAEMARIASPERFPTIIYVMLGGFAILTTLFIVRVTRQGERSTLVWLIAERLTARLSRSVPDVSDEAPQGGRKVGVRGRLRRRDRGNKRAEILRVGYATPRLGNRNFVVLEHVEPFEVVVRSGSTVGIDTDNVHLAVFPFGLPSTSDDVVLGEDDDVFVIVREDAVADPTLSERLEREVPLGRFLRGTHYEPVLVLPVGVAAERVRRVRLRWLLPRIARSSLAAAGLMVFAGYTLHLRGQGARLSAQPAVEIVADPATAPSDPQSDPLFVSDRNAFPHVVLARIRHVGNAAYAERATHVDVQMSQKVWTLLSDLGANAFTSRISRRLDENRYEVETEAWFAWLGSRKADVTR